MSIQINFEGVLEMAEILAQVTKDKEWKDFLSNNDFIIQLILPLVKDFCREVNEVKVLQPELLKQYPEIEWWKYIKLGVLANRQLDWNKLWGLGFAKIWAIAKHEASKIIQILSRS